MSWLTNWLKGSKVFHHAQHVDGGLPIFPSSSLGHVVCVGDSTCNRRYGGIHLAGGRATYGPTDFAMGGFGTIRCDGNGGTGTAYVNCDGAGRARYKEPGAADYGAWTDISLGGCYYLPGSVADKGAIVQIAPSALPSTDTTDSMTVTGSAEYLYDADDWVTWLRWMVGGAAYQSWKTFGVSGTTVAQCVASLPINCGSLTINTLIVSVGLNSVLEGVATDTIISQITQILDYGRAKKARIILAQLPPASAYTYTASTVRRRIGEVNARLEALVAGRNDVLLAPLYQALANPSSITGAYRSGMGNSDRIHLSPQGAYVSAKATLTELVNHSWIARRGQRAATAHDCYDATYNPYGNHYNQLVGGTSCTFSAAADTVSYTGADVFANGDQVAFSGTLPAELTEGTVYFVRDLAGGANTFKVAATSGGAAIDLTTSGGAATVVSSWAGGMMAGTGGSIAAGGSGSMPTRWRDQGSSGAVVWTAPESGSPVARTDGVPGNWFEANIPASGTGVGTMYQGYPTYTSGTYQASLDVQLASVASAGISLAFGLGGGHKFTTPSGLYVTGLDGATESEVMNFRTDDIVLYGSKACFPDFTCAAPASGGANIRIARATFRTKVSS